MAAALVPIKSITKESTGEKFVFNGGSAEPGSCAAELTSALTDMQKGRSADDFGWRVRVGDFQEAGNAAQEQLCRNLSGLSVSDDIRLEGWRRLAGDDESCAVRVDLISAQPLAGVDIAHLEKCGKDVSCIG